jgi:hypothetical protein
MLKLTAIVMAGFLAPEDIRTSPQALLLVLPVAAAITLVYKATKLPKITAGNFLKESAILFGSIVVFLVITALVLMALAWFLTK